MVDECEFVGGEGGKVIEAEKISGWIDTGLGKCVEIFCAEDEVGAVRLDQGNGECSASLGGVPCVGNRTG